MTCIRCHQPIAYSGDWPGCPCDDEPGLALTVREVASYMGCSRSYVYWMLAEGQLVANRATRPARIPVTSIKACWAADHCAWRLGEGIYALGRP